MRQKLDSYEVFKLLEKQGWSFSPEPKTYTCGFCGTAVTVPFGIRLDSRRDSITDEVFDSKGEVRVCVNCNIATSWIGEGRFPAPLEGEVFKAPRDDKEKNLLVGLYNEARFALASGAPSCAVLVLRKLLMHIAVQQGDAPGKRFVQYCEYLKANSIVGTPQFQLLDWIRAAGNEENHSINRASRENATELLTLATSLIKAIYFMS